MTDSAQENLNSKRLARNIRHRLADMLGSQWTGLLDAAMDEMLLGEIEKFGIIQIPIKDDDDDVSCIDTGDDGSPAWPLRKGFKLGERPAGGNPHRKRDEDGDPYLKGIMERD